MMDSKDRSNWLYVRFPRKIEDEFQVKELHEDIVSVKMPRQKGRFCWVECENEEVAEKVRSELHKKKVGNGMLHVFIKRSKEMAVRRKKAS